VAFPRTIWTFWRQGYDRAPLLVRECLDSWRRLNPGWRVEALDGESLREHVDLDALVGAGRSDITVQKAAVIARLCLLRRYGGVWTDATVYCLRPLDEWLPEHLEGGYFAFRNPAQERLASNWFIASEADDPILVALHEAFLRPWTRMQFSNQETAFGRWVLARLSPLLNTTPTRAAIWTNPWLQRALKVYPYFIFHYTFNALILRHAALRRQWEAARPLPAEPAHQAQIRSPLPGGCETLLADLEAGALGPVQKLDWRVDVQCDFWSRTLAALARATPARAEPLA
jgi:hypothetical protein